MINNAGTLSVRGLSSWYGGRQVLKDLSVDFAPNTITAISGDNGSGKSTLLYCCNRTLELVPGVKVTGSVLLDGIDIYAPGSQATLVRRAIGMIFQTPTPFERMTVYENVCAGPRLQSLSLPWQRQNFDRTVEDALKAVGLWKDLKDRLHQSGAKLSGGQKQRLCIARAMVNHPRVLLMDEPFSALDEEKADQIEELVTQLALTTTVILVTHNKKQAKRVAHILMTMKDGQLVRREQ